MKELNINKYISAEVSEDSVTIEDSQSGEVTLSSENFERLYREFLAERNKGYWVTEKN